MLELFSKRKATESEHLAYCLGWLFSFLKKQDKEVKLRFLKLSRSILND